MGFWNDIKHATGDGVRGVENSAQKAADGAKHALKDAWDGAVKAVKTEADAGIKGVSDLASNASHGVAAAASDFRQGRIGDGLADLGKGLQKGAEASISDAWHGFTGAVSQGWNGLNKAVHDGGRGLKNAYEDATDGAAHAIGSVAGAKAESAFRASASAVEGAVAAEAKLGWGFTEGVTEGAAGMVTGAADLVGGAYKYATDSQCRDGVNAAVEHGAEYVWNHPGEALDKAFTAGKNLAVSAWDSAATAVKTGDYESIGKGLGETAFTVATTVAAPEALIGKAGEVAEGLGALRRGVKAGETLADAGKVAADTGRAGRASEAATDAGQLSRDEALLSQADPMQDVMGPAAESHPAEVAQMRQTLEDAGIEVLDRPGAMAYGPGLREGEPGQMHIDPDASYSAWLHEYQHAMDDKEMGWGGMKALMDPENRWRFEQRAYNKEIELARQTEQHDVAERLLQNLDAERKHIFGEQ